MKLAISNIAWDVDQDENVAAILSELRVAGVEIAPTKIWPKPLEAGATEIRRYREFWERKGIRIVAFQALLFGRADLTIFESDERRRETLDYLSGMVRLAHGLGASALVFGSPRNRKVGDVSASKARKVAVDFFRELGEVAYRHDTAICIEPNPVEYDCDFVNNSEEAVALVEEIGNPGFRVHIDTGALAMNHENPEIAISRALPLTHHFHISEPHLRPIGTTGVDHSACARTLARLRYSHWLSIEMRKSETGALDAVAEALRRSIESYSPLFQAS